MNAMGDHMSEPEEREASEALEDGDAELLPERKAMSVLQPPGADVPLGPDELPPIKPA
jgi:hypothetical protein